VQVFSGRAFGARRRRCLRRRAPVGAAAELPVADRAYGV